MPDLLIFKLVLHVTWNRAFIDAEYLRDYCREGKLEQRDFQQLRHIHNKFVFHFLLLFSFQPSFAYTVCARARFHCDSCASCFIISCDNSNIARSTSVITRDDDFCYACVTVLAANSCSFPYATYVVTMYYLSRL
jgi:hypothetical protein